MEGKQILVPLGGIVRNTPPTMGADGEMDELINLRYKDGALRPIPHNTLLYSGLEYFPIYIHRNSGYSHFLGVKTGKLYHFANEVEGELVNLSAAQEISAVGSGVSFTQIGNVININDAEGLKYAIWYDSTYILISSAFDGDQTSTELLGRVELKVNRKGTATERDVTMYYSDGLYHGAYNNDQNSAEAISQNAVAKGLFAKAIGLEAAEGNLHGFVQACTAIELFDGSYILHSNPVLLGQSLDAFTRYDNTYNYLTNKASFVDTVLIDESESGERWDPRNTPEGFTNDTVKKRYTGRSNKQYRGQSLTKEVYEAPNLYAQLVQAESTGSSYIYCTASSNELQFKINSNVPLYLKPLIKSVSIFISPEVSIYKTDTSKYVGFLAFLLSNGQVGKSWNWQPEIKTNAEIIKELSELKNFYKVHEIPFDDIKTTDWTVIDLKGKLGDNLVTREALPIDDFSHHQVLPEYQFMYNSKLHVANYSMLLSRGWPLAYFKPNQGDGQFPITSSASNYTYYCVVHIQTTTGMSKVVRRGTLAEKFTISPLLAYPDSRAKKIEIILKSTANINGTQITSSSYNYFELKEATTGNYAYYISPDMKPIALNPFVQDNGFTAPVEVQREQLFPNAFKVSGVNNPFTFPAGTTYQVGNAEILAMASNSVAMSTGQYGEFPLLVFCSDGVYAMFVGGGDITYSASRPVARDVCTNARSVRSVDGGVVFASDRGLMLISGDKVVELSESLAGKVISYTDNGSLDYLNLFSKAIARDGLVQLSGAVSSMDFTEYAEGAIIGYNHSDKEIWVTNPDEAYSYVYSSGRWAKSDRVCAQWVNAYPQDYMLTESGDLYRFTEKGGDPVEVALLTRPIKYGTQGFKQTTRAVLRAMLKTEAVLTQNKYTGVYVFGSYDGFKWAYLGGTEKKGLIRDLGATVERTDCKYYKLGFVGRVSEDSYLNNIALSAQEKLGTKLR